MKKEGWFNWDGSTNFFAHWKAKATVVDDFGNLLHVRRCCECRLWKEQTVENFYPARRHPSGHVAEWDAQCKPCFGSVRMKRRRAMPKKDRQASSRATYERIKADPERLARKREINRQAQLRYRKTAAYREVQKRSRKRQQERIRQDPQLLARFREADRFSRRLRKERMGTPSRPVKKLPGGKRGMKRLPVGPMLVDIERRLRDFGSEVEGCEVLGIEPRNLSDWRQGRRKVAQLGSVDRYLVGTGLNWWDIWGKPANGHVSGRPQDVLAYIDEANVYIAACLAFEGELVE